LKFETWELTEKKNTINYTLQITKKEKKKKKLVGKSLYTWRENHCGVFHDNLKKKNNIFVLV